MIRIEPLGDQAAIALFANEEEALGFAAIVRDAEDSWLVDVVSAYRSVAVYFDLTSIRYGAVAQWLTQLNRHTAPHPRNNSSRTLVIPCCYELQSDLERVTRRIKRSPEEVIRLHAGTSYTVFAIGFCPGFPYLGYLPRELCDVPRLDSPRLRVEAGSVGLTGHQTGIYTEVRPGGWNLIGRTPLELVNVADGYFPLRAGDRVEFKRIDVAEFRRLKGQRL